MRSTGLPHRAHRHNIQLKRPCRSRAGCRSRSRNQLPRCSVTREAPLGPAAPRVFIFGLGYVGVALAVTLRSRGWHVSGTCRDEEAVDNFRSEGVDAHVLDADKELHLSSEGQRAAAAASHIVTTVPPVADFDRDPVLEACQKLLVRLAPTLTWLGYVSSTGVYGDHQGSWVDEGSPLRADSGKNLARLRAEQAWQALHQQQGLPLHIFRLGGIYGPGRSALDAATQQGASPSQVRRGKQKYTARCHVHDIVSVLLASMLRPCPGAVYNIVDDEPAPRSEVMAFARQLLQIDDGSGKDSGPSSAADDTAAGVSGASSAAPGPPLAEKRVRNRKIKEELGVVLLAPTYREGLTALHQRDLTPFV